MAIVLDGTNGIDTPAIDIAGEPASAVYTATVTGSAGTSDWSGSDPVTAVITVSGLLSTDTPVVDIDLTGVTFANVADTQTDWGLVYAVSATADNQLTLYATAEPASAFDIVIQVTR
jgi:hypothetical protein